MGQIVEFIDEVLMNHDTSTKLEVIKEKINQMMGKYPLFTY